MGGERLRADLRQLHAGGRDAGRHPRSQAHHARRRRHLLRRVRAQRAGDQRRSAHRGPRHHGRRRCGERARHPVHHPSRVPRPRDPCGRPGRVGRRFGPRPRPRAGHRRRAGRVLELAGHLLVQPGLRCRCLRPGRRLRARVRRPPGPPDRLHGVPLRCRVLGLPVRRGDPRGGVGLHHPFHRRALRPVRPVGRRLRRHRTHGEEPHARPEAVPPATLRRIELRRLRRLLRHVLHLLLHRVVSPGGRQRVGLPGRHRLPPDGGRPDHRLGPHRTPGGAGRARGDR